MLSMWFTALLLLCPLNTFADPVVSWHAYLRRVSITRHLRTRPPRKPPDPYPIKIYGAWYRWQSGRTVCEIPLFKPPVPTHVDERSVIALPRLTFGASTPAPQANVGVSEGDSRGKMATTYSVLPRTNKASQVFPVHPQAFYTGVDAIEPIILDTGASLCVSHSLSDFIGGLLTSEHPRQLGGLAHGLPIEGKGTTEWAFTSDQGQLYKLRFEAYYVPTAKQRLLSPQALFQQGRHKGKFSVDDGIGILSFSDGTTISRGLDQRTNLPILYGVHGNEVELRNAELNLAIEAEGSQTLTEGQLTLLRWHCRLGHLNMRAVQSLLKSGALGHSKVILSAAKCEHPKCASCMYGKNSRRPTEADVKTPKPERAGSLKHEDLFPGQRVSVDHFVCSTKGRLYSSKGKTADKDMYCGGCLFVDHASGYIHVEHQVAFNAAQTLLSKHRFERHCQDMGATVVNYQTDNGVFNAAAFVTEIEKRGQQVRFSGVGAHHQNGVAERNIGTIMRMARTMMLHAAVQWPEVADASLWPMAVDYAVFIFNHVPNPTTGVAPIEMMTRSAWPRQQLQNLHVWGCPSYVLDPALRDGKKIPRWKPRSKRSIFVGLSPVHANTIPLILFCDTLAISPQFHVVFDDWFTTVISQQVEDEAPPWWETLFGDDRFHYRFDTEDDAGYDADGWLRAQLQAYDKFTAQRERVQRNATVPPFPVQPVTGGELKREIRVEMDAPQDLIGQQPQLPTPPIEPTPFLPPPSVTPAAPPPPEPPPDFATNVPFDTPLTFADDDTVRRSNRTRRAPQRFGYDGDQGSGYFSPVAYLTSVCSHIAGLPSQREQQIAYSELLRMNFDENLLDEPGPLAFLASVRKDPDTLKYHEALHDDDWEGFKEAMQVEIQALESMGTWEVVKRSSVKKHVLPGTWAFRRKRYPDGRVRKLKARFCVRGDKQIEGIDYFETYAPVVSWSTVRLLLVASLAFDLKTRQVDYVNAFAQGDLEEEVYLEIPKGFRADSDDGEEYVLKLKKSLYGMVQSPRNFFNKLSSALHARGFRSSKIDPCLFIHEDMICLVYVDDCIFFARDVSKIEAMIEDLKRDFKLEMEGEVSAFLGIQIDHLPTGGYQLNQRGLKQKVIEYCGLADCKPDKTPASVEPLGSDKDGHPFSEPWSYAAAVGMLMYLSANSCPEIGFAVHQCARFSHAPKESHGKAVKRICRYLKGTLDKGLILKPTKELAVDCYVDADFAGLWAVEDNQDPICVKSRTGYVLVFAGCPVQWVSKLQTEVALSTMEAEYIALSQAMRDLLPMREVVSEIAEFLKLGDGIDVRTYSKVFEDNNGALALATSPRMTPRSKHIAVKYHFFREHVTNGDCRILPIDTLAQKADLFTKGLQKDAFERLRNLLCGW